jgi:hypothetical protein
LTLAGQRTDSNEFMASLCVPPTRTCSVIIIGHPKNIATTVSMVVSLTLIDSLGLTQIYAYPSLRGH